MGSTRICMQWTLVMFNTLSVIIGILGIIVCVFEMDRFVPGTALYAETIVQIVGGALLVASAFVGCCGAVNGSIKILCIYIFVMLSLIVVHSWRLWRYNESKLLEASGEIVIHAWMAELVRPGGMNALQERFDCCGKESYTDYTSLGLSVPAVCLRLKQYPYVEGCWYAVKQSYLEFYRFEKIANACVVSFDIIGILLSIFLICRLSTKTRRYQY